MDRHSLQSELNALLAKLGQSNVSLESNPWDIPAELQDDLESAKSIDMRIQDWLVLGMFDD
jgi:hypothetical protein